MARRSRATEALSPGIVTRDLAVPARMMVPRPRLGHGSPGHRVEGPWNGRGPEVDVEDDRNREEDERRVVDEHCRDAEGLRGALREPEDQAREDQPHSPECDGVEEELLASVVLAHVLVAFLVSHVGERLWSDPRRVLWLEAHVGEP